LPGERFGLAGESGSGKSTLALAILRLIKPPGRIQAGEVWLAGTRLAELTRVRGTPDATASAAAGFFAALGFEVEWVDDAPGLVLGRIVCQLVNEAAFAIGEGVGSAADVDAGLELGMNHPRGPVAWSRAIGVDHVLATLDGLYAERGEERYRAAPLLRRAAAIGADVG